MPFTAAVAALFDMNWIFTASGLKIKVIDSNALV
jgi:hypothetical protein